MNKDSFYEASEFNNLKELFYNSVNKYGNNVAFVTKYKINNEVKYENKTYKDVLDDVNALGTKIFDMNLNNKRFAVVGRNSYKWALSHLTNLLGGNISIPLDKDLQYEELESSLIRSKADVIFFDEKYADNIAKLKQNGKTNLSQYISFNKLEGFQCIDDLIKEGKKLVQSGKKDYIDAKIKDEDLSILLFTSGTTSQSKAVMLSQKNIASNVYAMLCVEKFYDTDVNIAFLPFHHIFGSTCLIVMLSSGVKTVFPDGLKYIKQNLKEYGVSVFVGVPLLIEAMYKNVQKEIQKQGKEKLIKTAIKVSNALLKVKIDIRRKLFKQVIDGLGGHLRFIISGGAPADKEVIKAFNAMGIETVQGYGLTETAPVIAAENNRYKRTGSVGIPMKNLKVEIVNKDEDGIGEIRTKGPNVMLGYYENEEATDNVLKDGWFHTGDLGYLDDDGFLFITGRRKDMIVLKNGKKVFPEELESLVNRLDVVEESFVYGMPDENDKNDVKLSIKVVYNKEQVKEKYGEISQEELHKNIWEEVKEINKLLPKYKYIKSMIITDEELVKTTTKKIKRQEEMKKILK